jgi:hypothetical protein
MDGMALDINKNNTENQKEQQKKKSQIKKN